MTRIALSLALALLPAVANAQQPAPSVDEAVTWLEKESHRIVRASMRRMKNGTAAFPPQVGIGYEAFWLRDYAYTLEGAAEAYSDEELLAACRLFVRSMREDGAGVDCVKFDGTPIYKPGYGSMGENPVADGSQFTVGMAWHTYRKTGSRELLTEILDPLVRTMKAVPRNPDTGLVHIKPGAAWDRCPYGFTDTVRKQKLPNYLASACLPLAGIRAMQARPGGRRGSNAKRSENSGRTPPGTRKERANGRNDG